MSLFGGMLIVAPLSSPQTSSPNAPATRGSRAGGTSRPAEDDAVWKALADPTRRALLDALSDAPATTGELVDAFDTLSRTGVMKHLDILEHAGLLVVTRDGRVRWNHLNPVPIQRVHDRWVSRHVRGTASALSRLKDHVEAGVVPKRTRRG